MLQRKWLSGTVTSNESILTCSVLIVVVISGECRLEQTERKGAHTE